MASRQYVNHMTIHEYDAYMEGRRAFMADETDAANCITIGDQKYSYATDRLYLLDLYLPDLAPTVS
jgi:hypothetical protein